MPNLQMRMTAIIMKGKRRSGMLCGTLPIVIMLTPFWSPRGLTAAEGTQAAKVKKM